MSMTIAHLVGKGLLSYSDKVSKVWPEFAAGGKGDVTLGELCAHSGGVSWVDEEYLPTIEEAQMGNEDALEAKIAGQPHNHGGELTKSYHAISRGWYLNALIRRVHPEKKTHGAIFRDVINKQLGVEVYCGLPKELHSRVSTVHEEPMLQAQMDVMLGETSLPIYKSLMTIPKGAKKQSVDSALSSNDPKMWTTETSAAYTFTNASSLGRLAALMSMGGSLDGFEYIAPKAWEESVALHEGVKDLVDLCLGTPVPYTNGGWAISLPIASVPQVLFDATVQPPKPLYTPGMGPKPGVSWTGWFGYGGSTLQWDAGRKVGVGYLPNKLRAGVLGDMRSALIYEALNEALEAKK
ncbi:beta-lactamase/transpeptidase-like protein [Hyaloraphidium curvatum]|nr:beta-lactamase/transpeptidase-like protein [Hyaloraphidium curvatum]